MISAEFLQELPEFLYRHLMAHPAMQSQDVYKLLYQGICGPEHIISSEVLFINRLAEEYLSVPPMDLIPLTESIRPDGLLHRVNLQVHKARYYSFQRLADLCLETSRMPWWKPEDVRIVWHEVQRLQVVGKLPNLRTDDFLQFSNQIYDLGYPPVHHSQMYASAEHPAYRLIAASLVPRLIS